MDNKNINMYSTGPVIKMKIYFILFLIFFLHLFIFERQRETAWAGEGQREEETQNQKQAPVSKLSAQSPMRGSNPWTVRSWPEPKSEALTDWATQAPQNANLNKKANVCQSVQQRFCCFVVVNTHLGVVEDGLGTQSDTTSLEDNLLSAYQKSSK